MELRERVLRFVSSQFPLRLANAAPMKDCASLEEEAIPGYQRDQAYPVRIGQTFGGRYTVLAKVGFGMHSTVWFAHDKRDNRYVTLKIGFARPLPPTDSLGSRELAALRRLERLKIPQGGGFFVRRNEDHFIIPSPSGRKQHLCIVYQPALMNALEFQNISRGKVLELTMLKGLLKGVLAGVDFLHREAGIVHCDIKSDNILVAAGDAICWSKVAEAVKKFRMPARFDKEGCRWIYRSVNLAAFQQEMQWGSPLLADLGEARCLKDPDGQLDPVLICADAFRPPEIRLGMRWSFPVDIWCIGVMTIHMLTRVFIFGAHNGKGLANSDAWYLARMVNILGPPPLELLYRSGKSWDFWTEAGEWKNRDGVALLPEDAHPHLTGGVMDAEEKEVFCDFLARMLRWRPEDRWSADQLLQHPWLSM